MQTFPALSSVVYCEVPSNKHCISSHSQKLSWVGLEIVLCVLPLWFVEGPRVVL